MGTLKHHHIRGIRQTIFSGIVVFFIGAVIFVGMRPSVFSKAATLNEPVRIVEQAPALRLPLIYDEKENIEEDVITRKKIFSANYIAKPQGLPIYTVTKVIDGNTIILDIKNRVKLIGIKAPEIDEEMGMEAYDYLKNTLEGKEVYFQIDTKSPKDFMDRMKGIIYLDKKNINIEILRRGFAHIYPVMPSIVGYNDWQTFETEAREAKRGLWAGEKPIIPENSTITP